MLYSIILRVYIYFAPFVSAPERVATVCIGSFSSLLFCSLCYSFQCFFVFLLLLILLYISLILWMRWFFNCVDVSLCVNAHELLYHIGIDLWRTRRMDMFGHVQFRLTITFEFVEKWNNLVRMRMVSVNCLFSFSLYSWFWIFEPRLLLSSTALSIDWEICVCEPMNESKIKSNCRMTSIRISLKQISNFSRQFRRRGWSGRFHWSVSQEIARKKGTFDDKYAHFRPNLMVRIGHSLYFVECLKSTGFCVWFFCVRN